MKKRLATTYAIFCTLLLAAGFFLVFFFALEEGSYPMIACLCGFIVSVIVAPIAHEFGHFSFGKIADMESVYVKAFCFQWAMKGGKKRLSFASPFAAEQTQMLPQKGREYAFARKVVRRRRACL